MATFEDSCGSTVLDMSREMTASRQTGGKRLQWIYCPGHDVMEPREMTEQINWREKDSCGSTVLDILESREMTEQVYWRAKTPVDLLSWTCRSQEY